MEVTKEGRGIVMRVPLEGGGRLVVEMNADEANELAAALKEVVDAEDKSKPLSDETLVRMVVRDSASCQTVAPVDGSSAMNSSISSGRSVSSFSRTSGLKSHCSG